MACDNQGWQEPAGETFIHRKMILFLQTGLSLDFYDMSTSEFQQRTPVLGMAARYNLN